MTTSFSESARETAHQRLHLPEGVDGALWQERYRSGVFRHRGFPLRIDIEDSEDVLFPSDCGLSLLAALQDTATIGLAGRRVLDIGCGSGLYSVAALSDGAAQVSALDINPAAVAATQRNARLNRLPLQRLTCFACGLGDFTAEPVYDVVITNPPHLPTDSSYASDDGISKALIGGADGREVYDLVIDRVPGLLARSGVLLIAHSSLTDIPRTVARLAEQGFQARTLCVAAMDIPLRAYAKHADTVLRRLVALREAGRADFSGFRFTVHSLAFSRDWAAFAASAAHCSGGIDTGGCDYRVTQATVRP